MKLLSRQWPRLPVQIAHLVWALVLVVFGYYGWVYAVNASALLSFPFDYDQGEGYDANSGLVLATGGWIYNDNSLPPYYSSNYPPVYSAVVALALGFVEDPLLAGRMVSLVATILVSLLLARTAWERSGSFLAAAVAPLLFLASNYVYHVTPLARVNALALLLGMAGCYCTGRVGWIGQGRPTIPQKNWLAGGVVLLLLALYTKPTTVDAVLAALMFLAIAASIRLAVLAAVVLGAVGLVVFGALELYSGGFFFVNVVVGNANPFSVAQSAAYMENFAALHMGVLFLGAVDLARAWRWRQLDIWHLYLGTSLLMAVGAGKWGAGESYFLGPVAVASLLAASTIGQLLRQSRLALEVSLAGVLLAQAVLFVHGPATALAPGLRDRGFQAWALGWQPDARDVEAGYRIVAYLKKFRGPVLSEDPTFALRAGKTIIGNATHLRNLHEAGYWDHASLVAEIAARRYDFVVLDAQLYPVPVLEAVGRYYYLYDVVSTNARRYLVFAPGERGAERVHPDPFGGKS